MNMRDATFGSARLCVTTIHLLDSVVDIGGCSKLRAEDLVSLGTGEARAMLMDTLAGGRYLSFSDCRRSPLAPSSEEESLSEWPPASSAALLLRNSRSGSTWAALRRPEGSRVVGAWPAALPAKGSMTYPIFRPKG